jgi:AraC-like DNA-binding protein
MSGFGQQAPLPGYEKLLPVSNAPSTLADSERIGWHGARYTMLNTAPAGRVNHMHSAISLQRLLTPMQIRRAGQVAWQTVTPGIRLSLPSDEFDFEWRASGPAVLQLLFIAPQQAEHVLDRPFDSAAFGRWAGGVIESPRIALLVTAMQQDLAQGSPAGRLVGDSLVTALVACLSAKPGATEVTGALSEGKGRSALSANLRQTVLDYIEANLATPPALAELAALADMSQRHFCRVFQASVGMAPHQYLLGLRVERARQLLRNAPQHGLADIALQLGFADQSQFSNTFKRLTGVTPSHYRAESRR